MSSKRPRFPLALAAFPLGAAIMPFAGSRGSLSDEHQTILDHLSLIDLDDGFGERAPTIRLGGANLQIVNGLGATNGYPSDPDSRDPDLVDTNGVGNLIVGYNELGTPQGDDRTGSHNIVFERGNS